MSKSAGLRENEIRRRVRRLLSEGLSVGATDKDIRFRGKIGTTDLAEPEGPTSAMERFKQSLQTAEVGDIFYLTFGQAAYQTKEEGGRTVIKYTDQIIGDVRDLLFGQYARDLSKINDPLEQERERNLTSSSTGLAEGQRLVSIGMKVIREIQSSRIAKLNNVIKSIKSPILPQDASDEGAKRAAKEAEERTNDSIEELVKILSINPSDVKLLRDPASRTGVLRALQRGLYAGEIGLAPAYEEQERRLIGAAQLIAHGDSMFDVSRSQTDMPGKRKEYSGGIAGSVEKTVGKSDDVLYSVTGIRPKETKLGVRFVKDEGKAEEIKRAHRQRIVDILIGGCVSSLTFPESSADGMQITSGEKHRLLEQSGLPLSVLLTIIELLIADIAYGSKYRGATGYLQRLASDPMHLYSYGAWGSHLDPAQTISIAQGFIGMGSLAYKDDSGVAPLRAGSRLRSYRDPKAEQVIRAITRKPRALEMVTALRPYAGVSDDQAKEIIKAAGDIRLFGEELGIDFVKRVIAGMAVARATKRSSANLGAAKVRGESEEGKPAPRGSDDDYAKGRGGSESSAEVAERVARLAAGESGERLIYERIMRRLLYGVTLVCVGNDAESSITSDTLKKGVAENRVFPIFTAKIEMPKQTRTGTIEDLSDLKDMIVASDMGPGLKKAGDMESGSKLASAGEATRIRGSVVPRAVIHTPNIKINVSDRELLAALESGSLDEILGDHGSYRLANAMKIPFVEKRTKTVRRMTVEDVLGLESYYDKNMREMRVAVQLLGAKKVHDPGIASGDKPSVTEKHLTVIPEMGIIPTGMIAEIGQNMSDDAKKALRKQMGERAAQAIERLSFGAVNGRSASLETYDLTGRTVDLGWDPHTLKASIQRTIDHLQLDADYGGNTRMQSRTLARKLQDVLRRSHNTDQSALETAVHARMAAYRINSLIREAEKIKNMPIDASLSANLRRDVPASMRRTMGPEAYAAARAIKSGLENEIFGSAESEADIKLTRVPAFSYIVNAALTSGSSEKETIQAEIKRLKGIRKHDPAQIDRKGNIVVSPLLSLSNLAAKGAAGVLVSLGSDKLNMQDALKRVSGDPIRSTAVTMSDVDDDDPEGFNASLEDLVSKSEELERIAGREAGFSDDGPLGGIVKSLRDLAEKIEGSQLLSRALAGGSKTGLAKVPSETSEWYRTGLNNTYLGAFLSFTLGAVKAANTAAAVDSAISAAPRSLRLALEAQEPLMAVFTSCIADLRSVTTAMSPASDEVKRQFELASALVGHAQAMYDAVRIIRAIAMDKRSEDPASFKRLSGPWINKLTEDADELLSTAQSYYFALDHAVSPSLGVMDRILSCAALSSFDIGEVSQAATSASAEVEKYFAKVLTEWERTSVANPRRAASQVAGAAAAESGVLPAAVAERFRKKRDSTGINEDQLSVIRAVLGKDTVESLSSDISPYATAARILSAKVPAGKGDSETIKSLKQALLEAFFPGVPYTEYQGMVRSGTIGSIIDRGREDSLSFRKSLIDHASMLWARSIDKIAAGDQDAIDRLQSAYDYISTVPAAAQFLPSTEERPPAETPGVSIGAAPGRYARLGRESAGVSSEDAPQTRVRQRAPRSYETTAAAQGEEPEASPQISRRSAGRDVVQPGNMASYPSAAAKLESLLTSNRGIKDRSGTPIDAMTVSDAISAQQKGELMSGGAPIQAALAAEVQTALTGAMDALTGLYDAARARAERTGEDPGLTYDAPGDVPVNMAHDEIMGLMPS